MTKENNNEQMTAEEYRQRMMQAFHNADCGELIALCVLPTEKEFEHLEWLLKNHYKKEPCEDCISREAVIKTIAEWFFSKEFHYTNAGEYLRKRLDELPSVSAQPKMGHWLIKRIDNYDHAICSICGDDSYMPSERDALALYKYCPNCGAKMQEVEE